MSEVQPVTFAEDHVPVEGLEEAIAELVDLYGGEVNQSREGSREFTLPLRRGVATGGGIACTLSWTPGPDGQVTVRLVCDRDVDAPRLQRILLLLAGVVGAIVFMLWPFFAGQKGFGALAWLGGVVALAVYLMTLRRPSGSLAHDFLQRLVARQRGGGEG